MPTSPDPSPRFGSHEPWRQLALALAAGLLGLIANVGAPMLGSGLPMRLDVVIVLCVAITAGPAWAALSATIATALVCWHVGHPTLMFVAVLEAVAVGSLVRRRFGIALASASFWIAAGVPILYGWSAGILQADSGEATAGALQQALNGVAQAVLVQILAAWPLARAWLRRQQDAPLPLRAQVFDSVIPLAVCPVIVLGLVLGRVVASGEEQDIRRELVERAAIIGSRIDEYLRAHDLAAASLALRVGAAPLSDAEAEQILVSAQRVYGDFDKIVLLDRAGDARVGASVLNGGSPRPFAVQRLVGDAGNSSPCRCRPGGTIARTSSSATDSTAPCPKWWSARAVVTPSGAREGIIKGSLNLSRIGRIAGDLVDPGGTSLMVVDNRGMVIGAAGLGAPGHPRPRRRHDVGAVHPGLRRRRVSRRRGGGARRRPLPHRTLRHVVRRLARVRPPLGGARRSPGDALLRGHRGVGAVQPDHRRPVRPPGGAPRDLADRAAGRGDARDQLARPARRAAAGRRQGPVEVQALQRDLEAMVARLRERDSHLRQAVADREAAHAALGETLASLEARVRERTAALAEATARAERATRAKGEFLANMSHEIRTPMSGVIGLAELLVATPLDAQQQELAQTVLSSGRRLLTVINNILDLSKIESGRLVVEASPFAFRPLVAGVVEAARATIGDRPVRIQSTIADDIPDWLLGDGARLAQVDGQPAQQRPQVHRGRRGARARVRRLRRPRRADAAHRRQRHGHRHRGRPHGPDLPAVRAR